MRASDMFATDVMKLENKTFEICEGFSIVLAKLCLAHGISLSQIANVLFKKKKKPSPEMKVEFAISIPGVLNKRPFCDLHGHKVTWLETFSSVID